MTCAIYPRDWKSPAKITIGPEPDLHGTIHDLVAANSTVGLIALYDALMAAHDGFHRLINQPRGRDIEDFLDLILDRLMSQARIVASWIMLMPSDEQSLSADLIKKQKARILFEVAIAFDLSIEDANAALQRMFSPKFKGQRFRKPPDDTFETLGEAATRLLDGLRRRRSR